MRFQHLDLLFAEGLGKCRHNLAPYLHLLLAQGLAQGPEIALAAEQLTHHLLPLCVEWLEAAPQREQLLVGHVEFLLKGQQTENLVRRHATTAAATTAATTAARLCLKRQNAQQTNTQGPEGRLANALHTILHVKGLG